MRCRNKYQHTGGYCGSYAVNNDPEFVLCDVCYAYKSGAEAMREAAAKLCECTRCRQWTPEECASQIRKIETEAL